MASTFAADLASILGQDEAGEDATLRTFSTSFDPVTGDNATTPTDTAVRVMFSEFSVEERAGGLVEDGDVKAIIKAAGITEPDTSAKLVHAGNTWNVRAVKERRAAGGALSYQLQVYR